MSKWKQNNKFGSVFTDAISKLIDVVDDEVKKTERKLEGYKKIQEMKIKKQQRGKNV